MSKNKIGNLHHISVCFLHEKKQHINNVWLLDFPVFEQSLCSSPWHADLRPFDTSYQSREHMLELSVLWIFALEEC